MLMAMAMSGSTIKVVNKFFLAALLMSHLRLGCIIKNNNEVSPRPMCMDIEATQPLHKATAH